MVFDYSSYDGKISSLEALRGKSGYMSLLKSTVSSFEVIDELVISALLSDGTIVDAETVKKLWRIPGVVG